ncbi:MAG: hypothetical protein JW894_13910 [Bacteroidales bacterium]|nr:hypothetical protein [Bacteroidales bacterium]
MKIKYQIFKDKNLLVLKYLGNYSVDHFRKFALQLIQEPEWKYVEKVLADYRETNPEAAVDKLEEIAKIRREIIRKDVLVVFLVDKPSSTVPIHLYVEDLPDNNKYCSTLSRAIELLKIKESVNHLEDILKNLNNSL